MDLTVSGQFLMPVRGQNLMTANTLHYPGRLAGAVPSGCPDRLMVLRCTRGGPFMDLSGSLRCRWTDAYKVANCRAKSHYF